MNMLYNDYGESVPAVGNEISIQRAKIKWPKLIKDIQKIYFTYPDSMLKIYRRIATNRILNPYIIDSILKATDIDELKQHEFNFDKYRAICHKNQEKNGFIQLDPSSKNWINLKNDTIITTKSTKPKKEMQCTL